MNLVAIIRNIYEYTYIHEIITEKGGYTFLEVSYEGCMSGVGGRKWKEEML